MVMTGRLSLRDDKEPQIVISRARPISDYENYSNILPLPVPQAEQKSPRTGTLYLRLSSEQDKCYPKVKAILNMFPGDGSVVLFFADTKQRRGTRAAFADNMLQELKNVLDEGNVVLK